MSSRLRGAAIFFSALAVCAASAREFHLSRERDRYTLAASNAPLAEILHDLEGLMPEGIRFYGEPTQRVVGTYRALPLEALLDRLGVTYALTYAPDERGAYHLERAHVLEEAAPIRARFPQLTANEIARVRKFVADLRSDDRPGNAMRACRELRAAGCAAVPYLEEALASDDLQQRQAAAEVLRSCCEDYEPSDRMLAVTAELLQGTCSRDVNLNNITCAGLAFDFLRGNSNAFRRVEATLLGYLEGPDRQARLIAALLLAEYRRVALTPALAPILIPHLADNRLPSDGGLAAYALHRLGDGVRPYVEPLLTEGDAQQQDLARLILHQLDHPDDTNAALRDAFFNTTIRNPVREPTWLIDDWYEKDFPDEHGHYAEAVEEEVPFLYTPKPGETLGEIARNFGITVEALAARNKLPAAAGLAPSAQIALPMSSP